MFFNLYFSNLIWGNAWAQHGSSFTICEICGAKHSNGSSCQPNGDAILAEVACWSAGRRSGSTWCARAICPNSGGYWDHECNPCQQPPHMRDLFRPPSQISGCVCTMVWTFFPPLLLGRVDIPNQCLWELLPISLCDGPGCATAPFLHFNLKFSFGICN